MALKMVDSYRNGIVGLLFKGIPFTPPSTRWLGISLTKPDENGVVKEPAASSGYSRYKITKETWSAITNGLTKNVNEIIMEEIKVNSGIGNYYFLADSLTGNAVMYDVLDSARPLVDNSYIVMKSGDLQFELPL